MNHGAKSESRCSLGLRRVVGDGFAAEGQEPESASDQA
jgi:hypothetical protein